MRKLSTLGFAVVALAAWAISPSRADLNTVTWNGATGPQSWQTAGNWVGGVAPDDTAATDKLTFAELAVPLAADLNVTLDNEVSIAAVSLGNTTSATATTIGGSRLVFNNSDTSPIVLGNDADFNNDGGVDGKDFLIWQRGFGISNPADNLNGQGDADNDHAVDGDDLTIWRDQYGLGSDINNIGFGFIETTGTAGVTNTIDSDIYLKNEQLEIGGTRNLTINGDLAYEPDSTDMISDAGIRVLSAGLRVNYNGNIAIANSDAGDEFDFTINRHVESQGTLAINGAISGGGDLFIGTDQNGVRLPLGTVELNGINTYTGSIRAGRGNLVLSNESSLGRQLNDNGTPGDDSDDFYDYASYRQEGPANQFGYNIIAGVPDVVVPNDITFAQWQTVKGENSIEFSGSFDQTNNRGFINLLPEGKTVTLSGRVNIWEDEEDNIDDATVRRFTIDGTGKTLITGEIKNDVNDREPPSPYRQLAKYGTGSLVIDVDAGDNNHYGPETVYMGNLHYADNDSLNAHPSATILTYGGAVGVDTGVATNSAFLSMIDPESKGGLMLAASDAAASLDFTSGDLANAANMSVAAPESGITYTGTITPADSTYKLGGGTGTLTLPNAQLTGENSLVVKNGGTVQLTGDNTYTGTTTVITKYTSTFQEQAAADAANQADSLFYDQLVDPVLEVDHLADGEQASSIGAATSDAENIYIQGSTLKYVGTGDSSNRLFTVGTGGATVNSSGSGAVVFSNTGALLMQDVVDHIGSFKTAGPADDHEINDLDDTSDIIVGMEISDPDPGGSIVFSCGAGGANCLPPGSTVTGISNDGKTLGQSSALTFVDKRDTRLVFGPVERTLTLDGTNPGDNTIASVIGDSAGGSIVNLEKTGPGKWILTGNNTYTGDTIVDEGILSITNAFLDDDSTVDIGASGILNLDFTGADIIDNLILGGTAATDGTWGRVGNGSAMFTSALITGNGLLNVGGVALNALATAVPEPSALVLSVLAFFSLNGSRRRVR